MTPTEEQVRQAFAIMRLPWRIPEIARLIAERDMLVEALLKCHDQFAFYACEHTSAGKHDKAATNQGFADLASAALSQLTASKQEARR